MAAASVKLVFPSELALVDLAHSATEKAAGLAGLDEDDALNVGIAVREAVINAILHGNRKDPSLSVSLTLSYGPGSVKARVADRGAGFDPQGVPDPTSSDNRMRSTGRGLLMMRAYVDDVSFRHQPRGGTEVTLVKRRRPAARAGQDSGTGGP